MEDSQDYLQVAPILTTPGFMNQIHSPLRELSARASVQQNVIHGADDIIRRPFEGFLPNSGVVREVGRGPLSSERDGARFQASHPTIGGRGQVVSQPMKKSDRRPER